MFTNLPRTVAAAVLSLAVGLTAMTATATPARADNNNEAAAIIAGIVALYAIGRAIDRRNDDQPAVSQNYTAPRGPGHGGNHGNRGDNGHRGDRNPRIAPAACFVEFDTPSGYVRGYGARCMQNNVRRPGLLPPECIRQVRTYRGVRNVYGGRCLAQNGWQREAGFRP